MKSSVKMRASLTLSILLLAISAHTLRAQTCASHTRQDAQTNTVPASILEAPITLQRGVGNAHEKVTTSSPQAQLYYDQGLSYLYSYDWIHAARSFHQSLRLDPSLAMAYLGLSYVYSGFGDAGRAGEMLDKARELVPLASAAERVRVSLRSAQLIAITREDLPDAFTIT